MSSLNLSDTYVIIGIAVGSTVGVAVCCCFIYELYKYAQHRRTRSMTRLSSGDALSSRNDLKRSSSKNSKMGSQANIAQGSSSAPSWVIDASQYSYSSATSGAPPPVPSIPTVSSMASTAKTVPIARVDTAWSVQSNKTGNYNPQNPNSMIPIAPKPQSLAQMILNQQENATAQSVASYKTGMSSGNLGGSTDDLDNVLPRSRKMTGGLGHMPGSMGNLIQSVPPPSFKPPAQKLPSTLDDMIKAKRNAKRASVFQRDLHATLDRSAVFAVTGGETSFLDFEGTFVNNENPISVPAYRLVTENVDYRCGQQVAKGGTSKIFLADILDPMLRSRNPSRWGAVVKIIHDTQELQQDEVFNQEVAIMADLSEHPNFMRLLGFSHNPKCMLMPYYRYGSLKDLIYRKNTDLTIPDETWNMHIQRAIMLDIANALDFMHKKNMSHNDIKPANVMLDVQNDMSLLCILCDFSISTIISDERMGVKAFKRSHLVGLSVAYAAPEILKAFFDYRKALKTDKNAEMKPVQAPAHSRDSYAFGITAYEVLTREDPYDGLTREEIKTIVIRGQRPLWPDSLLEKRERDHNWAIVCGMCETCWASEPTSRLTMDQAVRWLLSVETNPEVIEL